MTENSLVIKVDSTDTARAAKSLDELAAAGGRAEKSTTALTQATTILANAAKYAAGAFGLMKMTQYAQEATLLAARYETMGIVMKVAGNNAGYTAAQMEKFAQSLQKSGISMLQSRDALTQLATSNINLAKAADIGRAAQDLAVVAGINSSDAMARMIHGIKSGQKETLTTMGLNVSFEAGYRALEKQLGRNKDGLTEQEKVLARTNATLAEAAHYQGIYEESMTTAGKAMTSLTRYSENLQIKLGNIFLPALASAVFGYTDALKGANKEADKLAQDGKIEKWANNVTTAIVALTTATAVYAGVLIAQVVTGALSAAASFVALNAAHVQALAMNIALAKAEQARIATMIESTAAQVPAIVSELRYVMAMESVAATTETANAMAVQRLALQGRLAAIEEANVIAESQLAAATVHTAEAQALASASGSILTKTLWGTSVAADVASGALSKVGLALNILLALFVGFEIGAWMYNQFEEVRIAGLITIGALMKGFEHLKFGAQVAGAAIAAMVPGSESFTAAYSRIAAAHDIEIAKIEKQTQAFVLMEMNAKGASAYDEQASIKRAAAAKEASAAADKAAAAAAAAKQAAKEHQKSVDGMIASLQKEADTYGRTATQIAIYEAEKLKMTPKEIERIKMWRASIDAMAAETTAIAEATKAEDAFRAERDKAVKSIETETASISKKTEQVRFEIESIGKTKSEIAALEAKRYDNITAAQQEALAILDATGVCTAESEAIRENIKARDAQKAAEIDKSGTLARQAAIDAEKKASIDLWKSIDQTAHATFVNVLEGGKNMAQRLKDTFKSIFFDWLYQMTLQEWLIPVGVAGAGTTGVANAADLLGGGSGAGGIGGLLHAGQTLWSGFSGSMAQSGAALANAMGFTNFASGMLGQGMAGGTAFSTAAADAAAMSAANMGATFAAVMPYAAVAAVAIPIIAGLFGGGGDPAYNTGNSQKTFSATGAVLTTATDNAYGNNASADAFVMGMQSSYMKAAMQLGIGISATNFALGGNADSKSQNFILSGGAGTSAGYQSAFQSKTDAAMQLEASRAVFAALQGSQLPGFLAKLFDGLTVGAMSQQQISDTLAFAGSVKQMRDALLETRAPLEILRANVQEGTATFKTSATTFRNDFIAAIDAGINPAVFEQWKALGTAIDQLGAADAQAAAQAAQAAADAAKKLADAAKTTLANNLTLAKDAVTNMFNSLTAAVERERKIVMDAYTASAAVIKRNIDTVTASIASLRDLSGALTATLSSMGVGLSRTAGQATIAGALSVALAGGALPSAAELKPALDAVSKPSEGMFTSFVAYKRDFQITANNITGLNKLATGQLNTAELQLRATNDQLAKLTDANAISIATLDATLSSAQQQINAVNGTTVAVMSIADAVTQLSASLRGQTAAQAAVTTASAPTAASGAGLAGQINALYASLLGRNADPGGMSYWSSVATTGSLADVTAGILGSQEYAQIKAVRGYATGSNFIENDQLAMVHRGETITPSAYVDVERRAREETNALLQKLVAANNEMKTELTALRNSNQRMLVIEDKWDIDGMPAVRV